MLIHSRLIAISIACCLLSGGHSANAFATQDDNLDSSAEATRTEITVQRIWNDSPHNAFTDIIRWNDKFYCTFRTGTGHVPGKSGEDGKIQVIESNTGAEWRSIAHLAEAGIDLRDPKLSITPNGRLMLLMAGSNYDGDRLIDRCSRVAFLKPGETEFSKIQKIVIDDKIRSDNDWLWRVTWHQEKFHTIGYGVVYQAGKQPQGLHLVRTFDGIIYQHVKQFSIDGKPNESTIRFDEKGQMRVVVRNELGNQGHLGVSNPPYSDFRWTTIPIRLGGPNLIQVPDGRWIMGTRQYSNPTRTVIGWLADDGSFKKLHEFPSAGDTSYPGFLIHENELWVSYYSTHEGKSSIYFARIPLREIVGKTD